MPPRTHALKPLSKIPTSSLRHYSSQHAPQYNIALLPHRRLVSLGGHDASHFLQGLITQNIPRHDPSTSPQALYSAFLNAAGRVLYDTILYPFHNGKTNEPSWLIEVDEASAQDLAKHLKRYKLRAKVNVRLLDADEYQVSHAWKVKGPPTPFRGYKAAGSATTTHWFRDPRSNLHTSSYGLQATTPTTDPSIPSLPTPPDPDAATPVSTQSYHIHRIMNGIAEGPLEILPSQALPLESNMDLLNGIDFRKGCYVGQELTIRTRHTGVVRKRILPVQIETSTLSLSENDTEKPVYREEEDDKAGESVKAEEVPLHGTDIRDERGKRVGKWLGGVENLGLALCRLEPMVSGKGKEGRGFWIGEGDVARRCRAFVPGWMDLREGKGGKGEE